MILSFFDPRYPWRDVRTSIPQSEWTAIIAYRIIRGDDDMIAAARNQGFLIPTPNRSARIDARRQIGQGQWVDVRGSAAFFAACEKLSEELARW